MKLLQLVFISSMVLLLPGCVTLSGEGQTPLSGVITKLATAAIPDLKAAAADALAHNDPVAYQCWTGLVPVAEQIQAFLKPPAPGPVVEPVKAIGVFSAFQQGRDAKSDLQAGAKLLLSLSKSEQIAQIRQAINLACGALYTDVKLGVVDPLGLVSGVAR